MQEKELTDKELLFCQNYIATMSKTKAALASGYAPTFAGQQGFLIYSKPHVKAKIQELLDERVISGEETLKLVSDIATSDIKDYYKPVNVVKTRSIEKHLSEIIDNLKIEIEIKEEFCSRKGFTGEEYDDYQTTIDCLRDEILLHEITLDKNPKATKIVIEEYLTEEMQLDVNMLMEDKERGRIKKVKYGKDGIEVEMYAADVAQDKLLKVHGKYEKDNEQKVDKEKQVIIIGGKEIEF